MTYNQKRLEILNSDLGVSSEELTEQKTKTGDHFQSWEYHLILFFTNSDLYYMPDETYDSYKKSADIIVPTKTGVILAYK